MKYAIAALVAGSLSVASFLGGAALGNASATRPPDVVAVETVSNGARAWFDEPFDGSELPLAPIRITAHATDPMGVESISLSVDGVTQPTESSEVHGAGQDLAYLRTEWSPPASGTFMLVVTGFNAEGTPGAPATVAVSVGDERVETTPTTVTATTTTLITTTTVQPTTTLAPTTTITTTTVQPTTTTLAPTTTTTTPRDSEGPSILRVSAAPSQIYQGVCGRGVATSVNIAVVATDPSGVGGATLGYRLILRGLSPGDPFETLAMSGSGDTYTVVLSSSRLPALPEPGRGVQLQGAIEFFVVVSDAFGNTSQSAHDTSVEVDPC